MLAALLSHGKRALLARRHARNETRRAALGEHDGLPPGLWGATVSERGDLVIGGCEVAALASEFATPLLVVDRARLAADYRRFAGAFRSRYPHVQIAYSYKTNPLPGALRVLHDLGALAEVISHFELWLALRLGVAPERIVLNGPAKGYTTLELAVRKGVRLINIDSPDEIRPLAAAARGAGRRQAVGVRVVASVGWSAQFGLAIADGAALAAFRRLRRTPELDPVGLHLHLGTGIRSAATYQRAVHETVQFARAVRSECGIEIGCFDLGGGFGVPTVRTFEAWDERLMRHGHPPGPIDADGAVTPCACADGIAAALREFRPANGAPPPSLILEPGRALTSAGQTLILRVLGVKDLPSGKRAVLLDGGKNLALPTGYEWHELLAVTGTGRRRDRRYDFYGPLCHPGERLFVGKAFPDLAAGDLVAIMDAGAYFVPNQTNFSHPRPAAVLVADGRATLVRRRETFEDIVARDLGCAVPVPQHAPGSAVGAAVA